MHDLSLVLFVLVVLVNVGVLVYDLCLYLRGGAERTITYHVWYTQPRWGLALVGWQLLGVAALLIHFYW
jgi:hypothetical protein